MMFNQICFIGVPIAVGVLLLAVVAYRFWKDHQLSAGGTIMAFCAVILIFGPRVLGFDLGATGAKVTMEKMEQFADANIEAANNTLDAIGNLKSRIETIETTLKALPSPTINNLPNGNLQWDFGSSKGSEITPNDWCKAIPSLCGADGKPILLPQGKQVPWTDILKPQLEAKALDKTLKGLESSIRDLESAKQLSPSEM